MNPEALPSALSDLFLPEASNAGTKTPADRPSQAADADRFEQYLSSARRSVGTDQALPEPAKADDHRADRADARRQPIERAEHRDRPRAERRERGPADDRTTDGAGRDPKVDRRRSADADERRVDEASDRASTDDHRADATAETDEAHGTTGSDGTEDTTDRSADAETDAITDRADPTAASAGLDLRALDAMVTGAGGTEAIDGSVGVAVQSVEPDAAAETEIGIDGGRVLDGSDAGTDGSLLDAQLDAATDPSVTTAVAAATAAATPEAVDDETTDEPTIDLEDGGGPDLDLLAEDTGPVGDAGADAELDLGHDPTEADASTDADGPAGPNADNRAADGSEATTADAEGPAPVAPATGPVASTNARTATAAGQPVSGIDAVAGPAAPRSRTTGPTSTQAGQQAQAPLPEGEAGDPLWLQVRRAMGSLRTLQNGEQQMTIRLRPAELGSVMVRVNAGEHGTTVSLIADSAVAATQLTQQRQQLISELEQSGLAGVAVDVDTGAETDLRDGAADDDRDPSNGPEADGAAAAAAVAGAGGTLPRTGGRGRRAAGSSGSLVDVEL